MKIKDLPLDCLPREKALKYGFDELSDAELIAILLRSGTKDNNAIQLASEVLATVGGLNGLIRSNYQSLKRINGIKNVKALTLGCLITIFQRVDVTENTYIDYSIDQILDKYQKRLLIDKKEKVVLLITNRHNVIIKETILAVGTDSSVRISSREIFKEIFLNNGYGFYLIHTHPNAMSFPSNSDIRVTELLLTKCKKIGLNFLEHYVIGTDGNTAIINHISSL